MIEDCLDKFLKEEKEKLLRTNMSDLNGERLADNFNTFILKSVESLSKITDPEVLLNSTISALRNTPGTLGKISNELNALRREQAIRVETISKCYQLVKDHRLLLERDKEKISNVANEIKEEGSLKARNIGERPEKLKATRKAQAAVDNEAEQTEKENIHKDE